MGRDTKIDSSTALSSVRVKPSGAPHDLDHAAQQAYGALLTAAMRHPTQGRRGRGTGPEVTEWKKIIIKIKIWMLTTLAMNHRPKLELILKP
jgi:hypothetical protein